MPILYRIKHTLVSSRRPSFFYCYSGNVLYKRAAHISESLSGRDNIRTILSTPQLATKAIEYMEQTQILGQVGIRDT
jgi:hypothetical protein